MSISTYPGRAALALLSVLVTAGCTSSSTGSSSGTGPRTASSQSTPASSAPVVAPQACGARARTFWLPGPDGTKLEANAYGAGPAAVVFLHQAGQLADMCGFWPYARWLADREHVQVVLFNRCTYGNSTCQVFQQGDEGIVAQVQPAVDWARRHGGRRVTLVGASSGGSDALQAAGVVRQVDAVVDLSGASADTGVDDRPSARRLRVPALFAVAPDDRVAPVATVRGLYRLVPARPKRLVVMTELPGAHGWDLLQRPDGAFTPLAGTVADWVAGRVRAAR